MAIDDAVKERTGVISGLAREMEREGSRKV